MVDKIGNLEGKKVVVFATSRASRGAVGVMKSKIEARGTSVVAQETFSGFFRINRDSAMQFGEKINQM